jgi:hypothetical protein
MDSCTKAYKEKHFSLKDCRASPAMTCLPYCHYKKSYLISEHKHHSLFVRPLIKKLFSGGKVVPGAGFEPAQRLAFEGF